MMADDKNSNMNLFLKNQQQHQHQHHCSSELNNNQLRASQGQRNGNGNGMIMIPMKIIKDKDNNNNNVYGSDGLPQRIKPLHTTESTAIDDIKENSFISHLSKAQIKNAVSYTSIVKEDDSILTSTFNTEREKDDIERPRDSIKTYNSETANIGNVLKDRPEPDMFYQANSLNNDKDIGIIDNGSIKKTSKPIEKYKKKSKPNLVMTIYTKKERPNENDSFNNNSNSNLYRNHIQTEPNDYQQHYAITDHSNDNQSPHLNSKDNQVDQQKNESLLILSRLQHTSKGPNSITQSSESILNSKAYQTKYQLYTKGLSLQENYERRNSNLRSSNLSNYSNTGYSINNKPFTHTNTNHPIKVDKPVGLFNTYSLNNTNSNNNYNTIDNESDYFASIHKQHNTKKAKHHIELVFERKHKYDKNNSFTQSDFKNQYFKKTTTTSYHHHHYNYFNTLHSLNDNNVALYPSYYSKEVNYFNSKLNFSTNKRNSVITPQHVYNITKMSQCDVSYTNEGVRSYPQYLNSKRLTDNINASHSKTSIYCIGSE